MEEEVADLRARLRRRARRARRPERTSRWAGSARSAVALAVTGDGERNARRGLSALLAAQPVRRIVVVGVAGGLSRDLGGRRAGHRQPRDQRGGRRRSRRRSRASSTSPPAACGARRGIAVTATRIADTADEKRRLLAWRRRW